MSYSIDLKKYNVSSSTCSSIGTVDVSSYIDLSGEKTYGNTVYGYLLSKDAIADSDYNGDYYAVIIDDNDDVSSLHNNFNIVSPYEWIDVDASANPVKIVVSDNVSDEERSGYVQFQHKAIDYYSVFLYIVQEADERTLSVSNSDITGVSGDAEYSTQINVTVGGGNKKFYVKTINKYNSDDRQVSYDNAVAISFDISEYTLNSDGTYTYVLYLSTYGDLSTASEYYYKIILAHANKRSVTSEILLSFNTSDYDVPDIPYYE